MTLIITMTSQQKPVLFFPPVHIRLFHILTGINFGLPEDMDYIKTPCVRIRKNTKNLTEEVVS